MNQRLWYVFICLVAISMPAAADEPANDQETPKGDVWMLKKLKYSQQVLAGIASGDFDQIARSGDTLKGMDKIESFIRMRTPRYRLQLQLFRDANEEIIRQAEAENLEGVTLAFNQLTISCVNCHKHLRDEIKKAKEDVEALGRPLEPSLFLSRRQQIGEE